MTKLQVELHDDVVSTINKLKNINDTGIVLEIPEGAAILENILNLRVLKSYFDKQGKIIHFETTDVYGSNLIKMLSETNINNIDIDNVQDVELYGTDDIQTTGNKPKRSLRMPKISFKINVKKLILLLLVIGAIGGGFFAIQKTPKAIAKIIVNSQPLAKSLTLKVINGQASDSSKRILQGKTLAVTVQDTLAIPVTGEKLIGEKAKGGVTIYNKTSSEVNLKKGAKVRYENDEDDYVYVLAEEVTIPAITLIPDPDPSNPGTYENGEADASIEAQEIGSKYNLGSSKNLKVDNYATSELEAKTNEDIDGGKEETIKVVAQADIDKLNKDLLETVQKKAEEDLKKLNRSEVIINGSTKVSVVEQNYSNKLGEEVEELSLSVGAKAEGLAYSKQELDTQLDQLVKEFIPEGFVLSDKDRETSVEILGNTATTKLTAIEADIQVTLKTFVVPDISEDSVKTDLAGKSIKDAEKVLGSIRNIKSYELNISPHIPFLEKVPKNKDHIELTIERE
ncbi:hypothetical protein KAZ57_02885 [Patescibacteria group bacterium]|nr:hypothetical protein [Patescibacteria group bacterium]